MNQKHAVLFIFISMIAIVISLPFAYAHSAAEGGTTPHPRDKGCINVFSTPKDATYKVIDTLYKVRHILSAGTYTKQNQANEYKSCFSKNNIYTSQNHVFN